MKVLSIDIGGTNFRVGIVSESGTVEKLDRIPTASVIRSGNVLEDLFEFLNVYPDGTSFNAMAIGFPATLNRERTQVVQAPNIAFMENLPEDEMQQQDFIERIKADELVEKGFHDLWEGLKKIVYGFFEFVSGIGNAILGVIKGIIQSIVQLIGILVDKGVNLFNNFKDKVVSVWATIRDKIKGFVNNIKDWLTDKFGTIGTRIGDVIGGGIKGVVNAILSFAEIKINGFLKAINSAIGAVNKIPGVQISKIKTVSFPRLAKGGILNRPGRGVPVGGAIAGEAGREFYMPLQDEQMLSLVGQAIGKYITINANITNTMNGRVISRELQRINNESDFAYNR